MAPVTRDQIKFEETHICLLHSGMEEFRIEAKKSIMAQWAAINGIRNAAWVTAVSAIGSLIAVIGALLFDKFKMVGP